jgi:predicted dehydrogenase
MSRRTFLQHAGLITGGMLLHNKMVQAFGLSEKENAKAKAGENADVKTRPKDEKLKIALIGCGDRGKGLLEVMGQLEDEFEIVAICDVLDFRLDETQKKFPAATWKIYKDYRSILDDQQIDAIVIATPLNTHFDIASAAWTAGKHVYLEKTMTFTIPQALELVKMVKAKPAQILQVGHQYRYTPLYYKVKEMIDKGYLGKVTQIDCRWDRNGSWRRPVPEPSLERKINWRMYREYSGGLAAELLAHQIDFINWAFNTHPDEIFATGGIDYYKDGRETYDNLQVLTRYSKEGMIGNFGATCANARDGYLFKLKGSKGTVSLLPDAGVYYPETQTKKELETVDGVSGATKIEWNKDGGIPIIKEPLKDGTWYALKDFYRSVRTNQQPASNVHTGATTAICVHLANKALYGDSLQKWTSEYDLMD